MYIKLSYKKKVINIKLPAFKEWTLTTEGKQFFRYENLKDARRIIIFMYDYGVEWLREAK